MWCRSRLIYGLIAAGLVMGIIGLGFAELASAFPSAGGQYHIVYMVFPAKSRQVAAFCTGWISLIYFVAALASCSIFVANSILGLVSLWIAAYEQAAWHTYLMHILLCFIAFATASSFPSAVGSLGLSSFWLSLTGFIVSVATLLSVKQEKQPSSVVFNDYEVTSGWSDGWAIFIGISSCLWAYTGVDATTHLSEETENPSRDVPIAILVTLGLGIVTVVAWCITLMFVVSDIDAIVASTVPILEVYSQALDSKIGTTVWVVYYIMMFYDIVLNVFLASGRIIWSFSRDGGFPFSRFLLPLNWESPVRATAVMLVAEIVFGALYVISSTAYQSFTNLTIFALNITVVLPQAALLSRGRDLLPQRSFSLGKLGYLVNVASTILAIFFSVTFSFPVFMPTTPSSMNYLVVIMAIGFIVTAALWWGGLRHTFKGPPSSQ